MATYEDRQKEEDKRKKLRRVYSTNLIDQLIKDRSMGYDIDYDPFYNRDLALRAPGVTFRMTPQEDEEYQKCYDDPLYFIENYCKFTTDHGLETVDLRDFQRKIIKITTDEVYIPDIDDYGPKNRNVIWMAARQSGKCYSNSMEINVLNKKSELSSENFNQIPVSSIYYIGTTINAISRLKQFLYKLYKKL